MDIEALPPTRLVEAALFTAGRPVSIDELVQATGLDAKAAKRAVKALEMEYDEAGDATALEVGQAGEKWAMQLKAAYVVHARMLAEMEIPKKLLKTLALIAFHQPLLQSDLVDMIGSKTYDHVGELIEFGLVKARQEGQSKRLTTSPTFPEYFGIPATDTHEIRTFLAKRVGLTLKTGSGELHLESFGETPARPRRLAPWTPPGVPDPATLVQATVPGVRRKAAPRKLAPWQVPAAPAPDAIVAGDVPGGTSAARPPADGDEQDVPEGAALVVDLGHEASAQ